MKQIILLTRTGPQVVTAYPTACPSLFIHRPLDGDSGEWRITHVQSGYAILTSRKLKWAKLACKELDKISEWENLTPENSKSFFDKHYSVLCEGRDLALGGEQPH